MSSDFLEHLEKVKKENNAAEEAVEKEETLGLIENQLPGYEILQ